MAQPAKPSTDLEVVESAFGTWHYHIRRRGEKAALCGTEWIMSSNTRLADWGIKTIGRESYCEKCKQLSKQGEVRGSVH